MGRGRDVMWEEETWKFVREIFFDQTTTEERERGETQ